MSTSWEEKARSVRGLVCDVDGVLTTGALLYDSEGCEYKAFYAHDGIGLKLLARAGVALALITARESVMVTRRAEELGIEDVYQKQKNKWKALTQWCDKVGLTPEEVAYIGDDWPDVPVLRRVGLAIVPANAPTQIQAYADWVTMVPGGQGAVREVCDHLITIQQLEQVYAPFLAD